MANVIKHSEWIKQTDAGLMSIRNSELKAVDIALLRHEQSGNISNFEDLRRAFLRFIQTLGANWKGSDRNKKYSALTTLYEQLHGITGPKKTGQDIVALSHIRAESRAIITDLFAGKKLEWRPGILSKLNLKTKSEVALASISALSIVANVKTVSGGGGSRGGGAALLAEKMLKELVPVEQIRAEVAKLMVYALPAYMPAFVASLTPFVGVLTSGATTLYSASKTLCAQYRMHESRVHRANSLAINEPASAIEGIIQILERERNNLAANTAIGATEFGGKLAGVLLDGGTATNAAIGLAGQVATISIVILRLAQDVQERQAANKIMESAGGLGIELFEASPILGAYMVCCVPTSVMVNTVFERFFERGWRGEVERNVTRHLSPLRMQSQRLIKDHRFIIPSLQNYPGIMGVNNDELKKMAAKKGQSGMVGYGSDTSISDLPADVIDYMFKQAILGN